MAGNFSESDASENSSSFSSINVTPFVDVVLVLLVIFMITAPMLIKDMIDLNLPKTATSDGQKAETIGIALNKEGQILLNGVLVDDETLKIQVQELVKNQLQNHPQNSGQIQGVISADVDLTYGKVVKVIDILKLAGLEKFAIQIEKEVEKK